jgi:hypothetical protein
VVLAEQVRPLDRRVAQSKTGASLPAAWASCTIDCILSSSVAISCGWASVTFPPSAMILAARSMSPAHGTGSAGVPACSP